MELKGKLILRRCGIFLVALSIVSIILLCVVIYWIVFSVESSTAEELDQIILNGMNLGTAVVYVVVEMIYNVFLSVLSFRNGILALRYCNDGEHADGLVLKGVILLFLSCIAVIGQLPKQQWLMAAYYIPDVIIAGIYYYGARCNGGVFRWPIIGKKRY